MQLVFEHEKYDYRDWDFKIVAGKDPDVQMVLNQWKHKYLLHIIAFEQDQRTGETKMLLARREHAQANETDRPRPF